MRRSPKFLLRALLVLAIASVCVSQTIAVGNLSGERQLRWAVVSMPLSQAEQLPDECLVNGRFLAVKEQQLGVSAQVWSVRLDLAARAELALTDWQPLPAGVTIPPFEMSDRITDWPERAVVRMFIHEDVGDGLKWSHSFDFRSGNLVHQSKARQVWEHRMSRNGWHGVVFSSFFSGQDVVELRGGAVWSTEKDPRMKLPLARVPLKTGLWPLNTGPNPPGEPLEVLLSSRLGARKLAPNYWRIWEGPVVHGTFVPFTAVLLPESDTPSTGIVPIRFAEQGGEAIEDSRDAMLAAARGGPIASAAVWPDGEWLAFGRVPQSNERSARVQFAQYFTDRGSLYDQRPLANHAGNHGGTGAQPPFAAMRGSKALNGDWINATEILYSGEDYLLRGFHHYTHGGERVTHATRPGVETWSGTIEMRAGQDPFGKARQQPNGWANIGPRNITADDEHRAGAYMAYAYVGSGGDPLLLELMTNVVGADEMRAKPARQRYDAGGRRRDTVRRPAVR